jgi:hypothetical protein
MTTKTASGRDPHLPAERRKSHHRGRQGTGVAQVGPTPGTRHSSFSEGAGPTPPRPAPGRSRLNLPDMAERLFLFEEWPAPHQQVLREAYADAHVLPEGLLAHSQTGAKTSVAPPNHAETPPKAAEISAEALLQWADETGWRGVTPHQEEPPADPPTDAQQAPRPGTLLQVVIDLLRATGHPLSSKEMRPGVEQACPHLDLRAENLSNRITHSLRANRAAQDLLVRVGRGCWGLRRMEATDAD